MLFLIQPTYTIVQKLVELFSKRISENEYNVINWIEKDDNDEKKTNENWTIIPFDWIK